MTSFDITPNARTALQAATGSAYMPRPKEMELHESEKLVSIVQGIAINDKSAGGFIESLLKRNPSKYWHLRKEASKGDESLGV